MQFALKVGRWNSGVPRSSRGREIQLLLTILHLDIWLFLSYPSDRRSK